MPVTCKIHKGPFAPITPALVTRLARSVESTEAKAAPVQSPSPEKAAA